MEKISGVVITYNEEQRIEGCLKSLIPFCDELVLVDSFSVDSTLEIASRYTSRIFQRKPEKIISQISYATDLAKYDWVFCLDADERISEDLLEKIIQMRKTGFKADAYKIHRLNYYINDFYKYGGWYPDSKIRLFKRSKGHWGGDEPHYKVIMNAGSKIEVIKNDIIHFSYRDLFHQIEKMNQFSSRLASDKIKRDPRFILFHMIFNTILKFLKCYIVQGGFLAGTKGLINSVINTFYVFSKYAKLWEMKHSKPVIDEKSK